jgi:hypothetical protein
MPTSKYARKKAVQSYARNFSDADWIVLCKDPAFASALVGDDINFTLAEERANAVLKRTSAKPKPKVVTSLRELEPVSAAG